MTDFKLPTPNRQFPIHTGKPYRSPGYVATSSSAPSSQIKNPDGDGFKLNSDKIANPSIIYDLQMLANSQDSEASYYNFNKNMTISPPIIEKTENYNPSPTAQESFNINDFIDIINPLQNLPILGSLYRKMTGDEIKESSRLIGGTIYGGPIGLMGALADIGVKQETGKDIGANLMAALGFQDETPKNNNIAQTSPIEANFGQKPEEDRADYLARMQETAIRLAELAPKAKEKLNFEKTSETMDPNPIKTPAIENKALSSPISPSEKDETSKANKEEQATISRLNAAGPPLALTIENSEPTREVPSGYMSRKSVAYLQEFSKKLQQMNQGVTSNQATSAPNRLNQNPFSSSPLRGLGNTNEIYLKNTPAGSPEFRMSEALQKYENIQQMGYNNKLNGNSRGPKPILDIRS